MKKAILNASGSGLLWALAVFAAHACQAVSGTLEFHDVNIIPQAAALQMDFGYKRLDTKKIEEVNLYVRAGEKELCLMSPALVGLAEKMMAADSGRLSLTVAAPYLPAGEHRLLLKATVRTDEGNHCLKSSSGRSLIQVKGYSGANYELRCQAAGEVAPFIRGQGEMSQAARSWNFYYAGITGLRSGNLTIGAFKDNQWFTVCGPAACAPAKKPGWVDFILRGKGKQLELDLDGRKLVGQDAKNCFSQGSVGIRSSDQGVAYVDNVTVTDLDSGKVVFSDDFERDAVGDKWKVLGGSWEISKGLPMVEETVLGAFNMPDQGASKLPEVKLERRGDGLDLFVGGEPVVPLFFSLSATASDAYRESSYRVMRDVYAAGMRFFAPSVSIMAFDKEGHLDLSRLDDIMAQALTACPDAFFLLRMGVPPQPSLPEDERMKMARGQSEAAREKGFEDTKVEKGHDASLASETNKKHINQELKRIIAHMKSRAYGKHVLGMMVTGGGYEGSWGQCISFPSYLIDVGPAQLKHVGAALKAKYGNVEALRKAWDDKNVGFDPPSLPSLEERSVSDIAGFRDPAAGRSRRVLDFLGVYCSESEDNLKALHDAVLEAAPNSFFGNFYAGTCNSEWGAAGAGFGVCATHPLLNHPGPKFIAGILSYTDRRAGGVSANTSMTWESFRMHGKMLLSENDIKTPVTSEMITEANWQDTAQTMRREFAYTALMEHNALWYFDMGYTGPWYDNPVVLDEMAQEMKVGKAALGLERKNAAEILVVLDPNAWSYYTQTTERLKKGEEPPLQLHRLPEELQHLGRRVHDAHGRAEGLHPCRGPAAQGRLQALHLPDGLPLRLGHAGAGGEARQRRRHLRLHGARGVDRRPARLLGEHGEPARDEGGVRRPHAPHRLHDPVRASARRRLRSQGDDWRGSVYPLLQEHG